MSDDLEKIALAVEAASYATERYTCVWIEPSGVHVNNPPRGSGFEHGKEMPPDEFIRRAKEFLARKS